MGLFNFIYKLTNILSNKRKLRIFFIIAIVVILVLCWSRGSFAATPEESQALSNYQLLLQESCFNYLTYLYRSGFYDNTKLMELANRIKSNNVYITTSVNSDVQFLIYTYKINVSTNNGAYNTPNDFTIEGSWELGVMSGGVVSGTEYPCKLADFQGNVYVISRENVGASNVISSPTWTHFYLPDSCYCVRSTKINDFLNLVNAYNEVPTTYNTSDEELQALTQAGFQNEVNAVNNATSAINDVNSSVEDVNQSVMDMIDTIVDPYVNVSQEQLPESNVQDESFTEGVDNLFLYIKNAFTGTPQSVSFPIPFTDKSFTIEPGFTENSMRKGGLSAMVSVIHLYWYYRIYSFIFLKYVELLEKLKEGEFEQTVGNIKKEVL